MELQVGRGFRAELQGGVIWTLLYSTDALISCEDTSSGSAVKASLETKRKTQDVLETFPLSVPQKIRAGLGVLTKTD